MRLVLSTLDGFRTIGEIDYTAPDGSRLRARMVEADAVREAEMRFHEVLHRAGCVTSQEVIDKILVPCSCEECGGIAFVQKFVSSNGRIIEVLECVSGNMVASDLNTDMLCQKQHSIVNGKPKELNPTEEQIRIVRDICRIDRMRESTLNLYRNRNEEKDLEPYYLQDEGDDDV